MEQRWIFVITVGLLLLIINVYEIEGGQGCPLPWNSCRHHCVYEVRTNKGKPCSGSCKGFTCVCLYGSACHRRSMNIEQDDYSSFSA